MKVMLFQLPRGIFWTSRSSCGARPAHEEPVRKLVTEQPYVALAEIKAVPAKEKLTISQSRISAVAAPIWICIIAMLEYYFSGGQGAV
jgi:hypothetical protein